ncbi:MAG: magnesium transporter CorA [Lachnospiraceae bacterium]|nr:magnesium transporter CorA [Lachnospiraceae bacterium]
MQSYLISERLTITDSFSGSDPEHQFVVVLSEEEWQEHRAEFDMGIEWGFNPQHISSTRAEVNYDSITGKFVILDRENISGHPKQFAFSLDEKGIIFIDYEGLAAELVEKVALSKKLVNPSLERFLYDFLEQIIIDDAEMLNRYDRRLDDIEKLILEGKGENVFRQISEIRNDLRDLKLHYSELIDVCQEFEENENDFFKLDNERYFRLVSRRIERLHERVATLVEFTTQLRDLNQIKVDEKQNNNIAVLTVISTIFMPLTLITGWYGMNFVYMPEFGSRYGYPTVIIVCIIVVAVCLYIFKKKKML